MKAFLILLTSLLSLSIYAQNANTNALIPILGEERYAQLAEQSPEKLEFMAFKNTMGYYITQNPGKWEPNELMDALEIEAKIEGYQELTVEAFQEGIDLLAYEFSFPESGYIYYRIGSTDQILVIMSDEIIRRLKLRTE